MAKVGFPLLGDVLYGTGDYSRVENPSLREERSGRPDEREREWRSNDGGAVGEEKVEGGEDDRKIPPPPLPLDRPIALHAARLASSGRHALRVFGRDPAVFDAGPPWWRAGLGEADDGRDLERALELRSEAEAEAAAAKEERGEAESSSSSSGEGEEVSVLVA